MPALAPFRSPAFKQALVAALPLNLVVVPYATLFGYVADQGGLDLLQAVVMNLVVLAGAAQITVIELLAKDVPLFVALAAGAAVNMRMALYSAGLVAHLRGSDIRWRALCAYLMIDHAYQMSVAKYPSEPQWQLPDKIGYYLGLALSVIPTWYIFSVVGFFAGKILPTNLGLDFAGVIMFTALFAPAVRGLANWLALLTSITIALLCAGWGLTFGVLIAALSGMLVGTLVQTRLETPQPS